MTLIETLRKPKININGMKLAVFDLSGTLLLAYLFARQFNLNVSLTLASSIPLSVLAHNLAGVKTQLTDKLNTITHSK